MKNKPITSTKLKVVFVENSISPFEEKDVADLHQFLVSLINMGLNNKDITNNFWGKLSS